MLVTLHLLIKNWCRKIIKHIFIKLEKNNIIIIIIGRWLWSYESVEKTTWDDLWHYICNRCTFDCKNENWNLWK